MDFRDPDCPLPWQGGGGGPDVQIPCSMELCAAAAVCKQHLVWHHETCIQMTTVHIPAMCVTLAKIYNSYIHDLYFLLSENELNLHGVNGKHEGNKVFGRMQ